MLSEINYKFAFTVEGFIDKEPKFDSRYVKTIARLYFHKDGVAGEKLLKTHKCTRAELDSFPPAMPESAGALEIYKTSETRYLLCFDQH